VLHLLHFTFGTIHPAFDHKDVYGNLVPLSDLVGGAAVPGRHGGPRASSVPRHVEQHSDARPNESVE
jgi:hypothetical protein